jgi:putative ATPase
LGEETTAQGSVKNPNAAPASLIKKLKKAEESFFNAQGEGAGRWNWDAGLLEKSFADAGFSTTITLIEQKEERLLTNKDLQAWFDPAHSSWGSSISGALGEKDFYTLRDALQERIKEGPLTWQWKSALLKGKIT